MTSKTELTLQECVLEVCRVPNSELLERLAADSTKILLDLRVDPAHIDRLDLPGLFSHFQKMMHMILVSPHPKKGSTGDTRGHKPSPDETTVKMRELEQLLQEVRSIQPTQHGILNEIRNLITLIKDKNSIGVNHLMKLSEIRSQIEQARQIQKKRDNKWLSLVGERGTQHVSTRSHCQEDSGG